MSLCYTGSGRHWINHLIEMSTGIQTSEDLTINGIVILDHFLDIRALNYKSFQKTDKGLQINLGSQLEPTKIFIKKFQQHQ